jgi:hypothetical protein
MDKVTKAAHGDLFCIPAGKGFTCLGFDVCRERTARVAAWLQRPDLAPKARRGSLRSFGEYARAMRIAATYCGVTGTRCEVELSPQLVGLEGKRVEVVDTWEGATPRRFIVGKSTGWCPCHLEIATRRSMSGGAAMRTYASVRVV